MEYIRVGPCPQNMPLGPKTAIFFDWDGTLADSMPLCIEQIRRTLEELNLPPRTNAELARCNGPTYQESVALLDIPAERAEDYLRTRQRIEMEIVPTWQRLFPGIKELLQALSGQAELVVVSNGLRDYLRLSMEVTGTAGFFARVQPLIPGKTKTQALRMVLDQMRPQRAVMVGDRKGDFLAGRDNGLPTVSACYGYGLPDEWALADRQAYSVEKLQNMLLDLTQGGA